jgi:hypothetical protein
MFQLATSSKITLVGSARPGLYSDGRGYCRTNFVSSNSEFNQQSRYVTPDSIVTYP